MTTNRTVLVRLRADSDQFVREMAKARTAVAALNNGLNTSNDQTSWMAQGFLALGPALAPLTASVVPTIAGLAATATMGAGAVGSLALAFVGLGDGLEAIEKARLDPSIESLQELDAVMKKLGPDGEQFADFLSQIGPQFGVLQQDARGGLFPGMMHGIESVMERLPELRVVVSEISQAMGDLAARGGRALAGPEFDDFFVYLQTRAHPILEQFGDALGNLVHGFAEMLMAFDPLAQDWLDSITRMSEGFSKWASGLSESSDFHAFVDYVREATPMMREFFVQLIDFIVALGEASAPVAAIMVPALTSLLDVLSAIARTDLGPILIGFGSLIAIAGRMKSLGKLVAGGGVGGMLGTQLNATGMKSALPTLDQLGTYMLRFGQSSRYATAETLSARQAVHAFGRAAAPAAAGIGAMALAMTDLDEKTGLANTAMGALIGTMIAPGAGTAVGATIGAIMDIAGAASEGEKSLDRLRMALANATTLEEQGDILAQAREAADILDTIRSKNGWGDGDFSAGLAKEEEQYAERVREAELAAQNLALAQAGVTANFDNATDSVRAQIVALAELKNEYDEFFDLMMAQDEAENAWLDSIASLRDSLKGSSLGDSSEGGRSNQDAIRERVAALRDSVEADIAAGVSADELRRKLEDGATAIINTGVAAGIARGDVAAYIQELGLTPDYIKTVVELQDAQARQKIRALSAAIRAIPGVGAPVSAIINMITRTQDAEGSIKDYYADGGLRASENHVAQIAPAGAWRVWAEPETGGEAYIPLAPSKRERSMAIWAETGRRLGVQGFADGGLFGGSSGAVTATLDLAGVEIGFDNRGIARIMRGEAQVALADATRQRERNFRLQMREG